MSLRLLHIQRACAVDLDLAADSVPGRFEAKRVRCGVYLSDLEHRFRVSFSCVFTSSPLCLKLATIGFWALLSCEFDLGHRFSVSVCLILRQHCVRRAPFCDHNAPVIHEGSPDDSLILLRIGFSAMSGEKQLTLRYLRVAQGKGGCFWWSVAFSSDMCSGKHALFGVDDVFV